MVYTLLERGAEIDPGHVALVCGGDRVTYGELVAAVERAASGLRAIGVRRGDRVAVCLENSVEAAIAIFAIARAGAIFVPIGRTVRAVKLGRIFADCAPVAAFADVRTQQVLDDAREHGASPGTVIVVGAPDTTLGPQAIAFSRLLLLGGSAPPAPRDGVDLDLAALIYTSGSSGRAKGVMLSHANMLSATASINAYLQNQPADVILDVLPLSFDYGLYQLFLAFSSGARVVLERAFVYQSAMLDLIRREGVTGLPIVPTLAALLARHNLREQPLPSLRYITNTGAPLPAAHIRLLRSSLPNVRIFSMYGLTECKRVSYLDPSLIDSRPDSVGRPMDNVEVFVCGDDGQLTATGVGELVVRGSNVMQGYWGLPADTARVLKPGRYPGQQLLHTGDRFRIDADGYMYFEARLDDMIKCRGQRVSPREVEEVLYELPGVTAASVYGIADEILGTAVKAMLVVDPGVTLNEHDVLRHCASRLEDFMVPKEIEFVTALRVTESGKIMRGRIAVEGGTA